MAEDVVEVTDDNFSEEVIESELPVMLDMWAPWCGPCQMVTPIVEELAEEYEGSVKIGKLNVDENPSTAGEYGVTSIPSVLFFKDGEELKDSRIIGAQSKDGYAEVLDDISE
ncbi:MAG: thioredoxin [Planctomycetota bacterium]